MGVDLTQYRSAIGCHAGRACNLGPRSRAKRRKKEFKEMLKEAGARSKIRKEAAAVWLEALNTSIMISIFTSITLSVMLTSWPMVTPGLGKTCSTISMPGLLSSHPTGDFTLAQKMFLALEEVIRMLLLLAGVESNPGPTIRMYLIDKPLVPEPSHEICFYCKDGGFFDDFSIFTAYSLHLQELLIQSCTCTTCKDCAPVLHLPDFSTLTVAHLKALLTDGETLVEGWAERRRVLQLKVALRCSGISRREVLKPALASGQCASCLRYVQ